MGSTYGGYTLYKKEARGVIVKFSVLRTFCIAGQAAIVFLWGRAPMGDPGLMDNVFTYLGFGMTSLTLFCAGVITTATFTVMMRVSQREAPEELAGSHYTTLATFEILGKLAFAGIAGGFVDWLGMELVYVGFVLLAAVCPGLALVTLPLSSD